MHNDMGQEQSSSEYFDVFDSSPPSSLQKSRMSGAIQQVDTIRGVHTGQANATCSYAVSNIIGKEYKTDDFIKEKFVRMRKAESATKLRSVSLQDDYSQPSDRLLASVKRAASERQSSLDYIEPYLEHDLVIPPDPGGIYALAKDVENQQPQRPVERHSLIEMSVDKRTHVCHQNDLVPNYEIPWDTEKGQQRLNTMMIQSEKKDIKRQSIDKTSQNIIPKIQETTVQSCAIKQPMSVSDDCDVYETSWNVNTRKHSQSSNRFSENAYLPSVKSPNQGKSHSSFPSCYEDAWDLPCQQRALEIKLEKLKLEQARRDSHSKEQGSVPVHRDNTTVSSPKISPLPSPTRLKTAPDYGFQSDRCALATPAEKIDVTIPLEDQIFYHGAKKRSAAERNLLLFKEGSYLIRRSETSKDDYSLTLKGLDGAPMHMKIAHKPDGKYILGENSPPFASIPKMVDYYTKNELPVQNADRICLMYPIPS